MMRLAGLHRERRPKRGDNAPDLRLATFDGQGSVALYSRCTLSHGANGTSLHTWSRFLPTKQHSALMNKLGAHASPTGLCDGPWM